MYTFIVIFKSMFCSTASKERCYIKESFIAKCNYICLYATRLVTSFNLLFVRLLRTDILVSNQDSGGSLLQIQQSAQVINRSYLCSVLKDHIRFYQSSGKGEAVISAPSFYLWV